MTTPTPRTDELKLAIWNLMQAQESEKVYAWRDAIHCGIEQLERDLAAAQEARRVAEAERERADRKSDAMEAMAKYHAQENDAAQQRAQRAEALAAQNAKDAERLDWFESRANEGGTPALIPDDDGRWAVVEDGMQSVPEGDGPQNISTSFWIEAGQWHETARAAIDAAKGKP